LQKKIKKFGKIFYTKARGVVKKSGRTMRQGIVYLLSLMNLVLIMCSPAEAAKPKTQPGYQPKYSAIVMDADTGEILESEDPNGIRHPASLTKMMTLYLLFEELRKGRLSLSTRMSASAHASRQAPSKLGLSPGHTITVAEAIQSLVTKSANDAAVVVAEHLAGSEQAFARRMTQKARALGMHHTTFKNASGLPNPAQVTTAYDMAKLSQALYHDFPQYYRYFKLKHYNHRGTIHRNHNHLLGKVSGVDGIKTGFIAASGFNLAASAVRYDAANIPHRLIAVVLGGPNRHWRDRQVANLLETNFQRLGITEGKKGWVETNIRFPLVLCVTNRNMVLQMI
jgi:D-alanyl-D-alanine carboxypeptidase